MTDKPKTIQEALAEVHRKVHEAAGDGPILTKMKEKGWTAPALAKKANDFLFGSDTPAAPAADAPAPVGKEPAAPASSSVPAAEKPAVSSGDKPVAVKHTKGGDYNIYAKGSEKAADFRKTYAAAKGNFEWEGRKYAKPSSETAAAKPASTAVAPKSSYKPASPATDSKGISAVVDNKGDAYPVKSVKEPSVVTNYQKTAGDMDLERSWTRSYFDQSQRKDPGKFEPRDNGRYQHAEFSPAGKEGESYLRSTIGKTNYEKNFGPKDQPEYESGKKAKKMSEEINPLIASFLSLQAKNPSNMFEAAKKLSKKQDEKLDVVDDDKIDAKDLAALRAGKKHVDEANIDPVVTGSSSVTKSKTGYVDPSTPKVPYSELPKPGNAAGDVLSKAKNALDKTGVKEEVHTNPNPQTKKPYTAPETSVKQPKWKINKKDQYKMNEEEVEQIDEIGDTKAGQKALKSYVKKADRSSEKSGDVLFNPSNPTYRAAEKGKPGAEEKYSAASLSYHNRLKGMDAAKKRIKEENEEVEFSQEEIDFINSFFLEASVAPNRPEVARGADSTSEGMSQNDLTVTAESGKSYFDDRKVKKVKEEIELDEAKKKLQSFEKVMNAATEKRKSNSQKHEIIAPVIDRSKTIRYTGDVERLGLRKEEVDLQEGRPKKNPTPETTERDPRKHIQVEAGRAAAGNVVDFTHNDGSKSKITPAMGRKITSHLNGLKPADRQAAVNKMHDSAEGLKV